MFAFMAESSATSTTISMIVPAAGMPSRSSTVTYGPSRATFGSFHGTRVTTTAMEPM